MTRSIRSALVPMVLAGIGAAVLAASGAAASSCAVYDSALLLSASDAGSKDAAIADGGVDAAVDADTCMHATSPAKPESEDGSQNLDIVFALHDATLEGATDASTAPTGLDIDGVCTCPGAESCVPLSSQTHCDGPQGQDNALYALYEKFNGIVPILDFSLFNTEVQQGGYALLLRIVNYNGGQNDRDVTAIIYLSGGIDGVPVDGGLPPPPKYDGTDAWTVDPSSLLNGTSLLGASCANGAPECVPLFLDQTAYVSGGVLVAHIDFPISLGGSPSTSVEIDIVGGELLAPLVPKGSSFVVSGAQIVGRWSTTKLLTGLNTVKDPLDPSQNLCGSDGTYQNIKPIICGFADVAADPTQDNKGVPCGALSLAVGMNMSPANLGTVVADLQEGSACGANYSDSCE